LLFKNKNTAPTESDLKTPEAFEKIYRTHWKKMFGICYYQVKDEELAKEMVQDIFKSLWERRDQLNVTGPLENYLVRAAKLEAMAYYRTKAIHGQHQKCIMEDTCQSEYCTDNQVAFDELNNRVEVLVDRLPCQCREVFKLSREKGLKNKEIASALLISEKAVEYHMTKALKFLQKNLQEYTN